MTIASFVLSGLAFAVSIFAAAYSRKQATASELQAKIAKDQDRRARQPKLTVKLQDTVTDGDYRAFYDIHNDGGEHLDSVIVMQPDSPDILRYPVARMGGEFDIEAEIGPISRKNHATLVLSVGTAERLPVFVVQVVMRNGEDVWEDSIELPDPRFHQMVF